MLSMTYVQVAMQLENERFREGVMLLQKRSDNCCYGDVLKNQAVESLLRLAFHLGRQCAFRRLEIYFWPEMRRLLPECGLLVAEYDALHQEVRAIHAGICRWLYQALQEEKPLDAVLAADIRDYCQKVQQMLDMEEKTFFSIAADRISRENWFSLARLFMWEQDDERNEPFEQDIEGYDPRIFSFSGSARFGESADSGLKYNLIDDSGLQDRETFSLHFENEQLLFSSLTQNHGRSAMQQVYIQNS